MSMNHLPSLFDSHAHLDGADFVHDIDDVLERARAAGVRYIVNIGATDGYLGAERSLALAERYSEVWCSVGVHPHDAHLPRERERLEKFLNHPRVCAVGETGLDFFKEYSPRHEQYEWFRLQVELALQHNLPLVIHSRDAGGECLQVLRELGAERVGGVFHCYGEDAAFAEQLRGIGFSVSFPGILTFPKAHAVHEAARHIPLEQILIETDAPYLAPVPFRGQRCESAHVREVCKKLAELKGLPFEVVATQTTQNALRLYKLAVV